MSQVTPPPTIRRLNNTNVKSNSHIIVPIYESKTQSF